MGWLRSGKSAAEIAGALLHSYQGLFSADRFHQHISQNNMAKDVSIDYAVAEWHAFGMFVFIQCLWVSLQKKDRVFEILDVFQSLVLQWMTLNEVSMVRFHQIAEIREIDYLSRYEKVIAPFSETMPTFFGYVYSRITGKYDQTIDDLGLPQPADALAVYALSHYSIDAMILVKEILDKVAK
jgi:hypothetical protein